MALFLVRALPLVIFLPFAFCDTSLLSAATLTWDGNLADSGQPDGGGNWNTTDTTRWANAINSQAWNNTTPDSAVFGTNSGDATGTLSVSLTENITVHGLSFRAAGSASYQLASSNGSKLTLGGPDTPVIDTAVSASISTSIVGTQGFEKKGTGTLILNGTDSNENTGLITISAGTLNLSKTAGVNAINGDIHVNGGNLLLGAANQIADTASITLDSGTLQFTHKDETIANLTLNGGDANPGLSNNAGSITITDTLTINTYLYLNSFATWRANEVVIGSNASADALYIHGNHGTKVTSFTVGSGGLTINGTRKIIMNPGGSSSAKGSQLNLEGDVTVNSGSSSIDRSSNSFANAFVNLGSVARSFHIEAGAALAVTVIVNGTGGITKNGGGSLNLAGRNSNTYTGMTTVNEGTLKVGKSDNAITIAGNMTVNGGILDWDNPNQIADTSTLFLNGGALNFSSFNETIANLYQSNGNVNHGGNTNGGNVVISNILSVTGGSEIGINLGGSWSARQASFSDMEVALSLSGNHTTKITRFTAGVNGAGGITLAGGQTINLLKGSDINAKGSEFVLDGSFTADGENVIATTGAYGLSRVNLKGGQRGFNINSGTTTIKVPILSTTLTPDGEGYSMTTGGITKNGQGTLKLDAANSYSGNTIINHGTFKLGTGGAIASSPRITVATSAIYDVSSVSAYSLVNAQALEGGGSVLGHVTIASGATLSPGTIGADITQTLTFATGLTLAAGSTTVFDLDVGGSHDHIVVNGGFTQQAGATLLINSNGFIPIAGATFDLFTFNGSALFIMPFGEFYRTGADDEGSFLDLPDISSTDMFWDLSQLAATGTISITPEPGRTMLLVGGISTILFRRRRQTLPRTDTDAQA